MPSDALFGLMSSSDRMLAAVSETAWFRTMLDVEAALARAESRLGLIPAAAADAIAAQCRHAALDVAELGRNAVKSANPVVPLVDALREALPKEAAGWVHHGATSQDILDTAMMLVTRRGLDLVLEDLERASAAAAPLAERHRSTLMAGRTLLLQALPTTFGLKAAGWLGAIIEARASLHHVRDTRLAIQFGGAAGTLAALGKRGLDVSHQLAVELSLPAPVLPWHAARGRVVEIANALGLAAGVAGKVALDVVLMAQTEVAEVSEETGKGQGGSSALPQKRNPVLSVEILAAVRGVASQVALLQGAMLQEHERAAGAWQAEAPALSETLRLTGGAVSRLANLLEGLRVDSERMRRNLDLTGGLVMAESVVSALSQRVDPRRARELVDEAVSGAASSGRSFAEVLAQDAGITAHLDAGSLAKALDPGAYLGASAQLIDRALEAYRRQRKGDA